MGGGARFLLEDEAPSPASATVAPVVSSSLGAPSLQRVVNLNE